MLNDQLYGHHITLINNNESVCNSGACSPRNLLDATDNGQVCVSECYFDSDCVAGQYCDCDGACGRSCINSSKFKADRVAHSGADKEIAGPVNDKRRKQLISFRIDKFYFIEIYSTFKRKFYKIYQTQVWVVLKKILMLTTNFYFGYC